MVSITISNTGDAAQSPNKQSHTQFKILQSIGVFVFVLCDHRLLFAGEKPGFDLISNDRKRA